MTRAAFRVAGAGPLRQHRRIVGVFVPHDRVQFADRRLSLID